MPCLNLSQIDRFSLSPIGGPIGDIQGGMVIDTQVGSGSGGVQKVPTGCPLWEEKGMMVLEGGRVLARGTKFCT